MGNDDSPPVIAERDDFLREEPNIVENGNTYYHPEKIESYGLRGDSLFYFVGKDNIYLDLPAKTSPILLNNKNTRQSIPVIYKRGKKFGLIIGDTIKENIYDSLVYFGNNYIAAIKNKNGYHFGMLNKKGEEIVPFIYDSIIGKMNRYNFIDNSIEGKKSRIFTVNSPDRISKNLYVVDATEDIVVYKNGKTGMINKQNQIIIPIEYDIIAENKISYYLQARTSSNIVLLKKDGLYGLTFLEYNYNSKHNEMKNTVPPVYQHIPCYYYNDYCNIKGFKLFGLYNESFDFLGYAHPNGTLYFSR